MRQDHSNENYSRNLILAAFFGFAFVFCLLMFMMNWHGEYNPNHSNDHNVHQAKDDVSGGQQAIESEPANDANLKNGDEDSLSDTTSEKSK